jgi:hypothetical protein
LEVAAWLFQLTVAALVLVLKVLTEQTHFLEPPFRLVVGVAGAGHRQITKRKVMAAVLVVDRGVGLALLAGLEQLDKVITEVTVLAHQPLGGPVAGVAQVLRGLMGQLLQVETEEQRSLTPQF